MSWWSDIQCACPVPDADDCIRVRHTQAMLPPWANDDDGCECRCHTEPEDEDWSLPEGLQMSEADFWFLIGVTDFGWSVTVGVRDILHRTDITINERRALLLQLKEKF